MQRLLGLVKSKSVSTIRKSPEEIAKEISLKVAASTKTDTAQEAAIKKAAAELKVDAREQSRKFIAEVLTKEKLTQLQKLTMLDLVCWEDFFVSAIAIMVEHAKTLDCFSMVERLKAKIAGTYPVKTDLESKKDDKKIRNFFSVLDHPDGTIILKNKKREGLLECLVDFLNASRLVCEKSSNVNPHEKAMMMECLHWAEMTKSKQGKLVVLQPHIAPDLDYREITDIESLFQLMHIFSGHDGDLYKGKPLHFMFLDVPVAQQPIWRDIFIGWIFSQAGNLVDKEHAAKKNNQKNALYLNPDDLTTLAESSQNLLTTLRDDPTNEVAIAKYRKSVKDEIKDVHSFFVKKHQLTEQNKSSKFRVAHSRNKTM